MMHRRRRWCMPSERKAIPAAVELLIEHTWTLCTAFLVGETLTLPNDSTSPDGAQEYAVVRDGRQIESLTVSWMKPERLLAVLQKLDTEGGTGGVVTIATHAPGDHCGHCR